MFVYMFKHLNSSSFQAQLEDIPVRNVNLPSFEVSTLLAPREKEMLPSISLDLSVNKIDLHLSTEILNQLLVVQSSFVKVSTYCA